MPGFNLRSITQKYFEILRDIRIIFSDVDGVLTDGGLYYTEEGLTFKKFNVKDGMAVNLLREAKIYCGIISTDKSKIIQTRAERIKMDFAVIGEWDKKSKAEEICAGYGLNLSQAVFIGDDVNDIELLRSVGFSTCPNDAVKKVKETVNYVSSKNGGEGIFREIADLVLQAKENPV